MSRLYIPLAQSLLSTLFLFFFFFNDTATTEIYTLSLHDALPIYCDPVPRDGAERITGNQREKGDRLMTPRRITSANARRRSEEHTSELQSRLHLVCRLLLEKKKKKRNKRRQRKEKKDDESSRHKK